MVDLDQGQSKPIPYGSHAINLSTTTCGLVILHTAGSSAVGYHWPYCSENGTYQAEFDDAIANVTGTSIEVVVNGGKYRKGDAAPADFGKYLSKLYRLPVRVYRQVQRGNENKSVDPWVVVQRDGVVAPDEDSPLIAV